MEGSLEDCYYFLYSSCKRGNKCAYRHCEAAKQNPVLCKQWNETGNCVADCPFRHSHYHKDKKRAEDYCFWEGKEKGCTREFCEFKHTNPEKDKWKSAQHLEKDAEQKDTHFNQNTTPSLWGQTITSNQPIIDPSCSKRPNPYDSNSTSKNRNVNGTRSRAEEINPAMRSIEELNKEIQELDELLSILQ